MCIEAVLHRVLDQPLEVRALVSVPARLEVDVLLHQLYAVVGGVASDDPSLRATAAQELMQRYWPPACRVTARENGAMPTST